MNYFNSPFNFGDDDTKPPADSGGTNADGDVEVTIPDTTDELIEEWQKDEAVIAALKDIAEAEAEVIEVENKEKELSAEQLEMQKKINELQSQSNALNKKKARVDTDLYRIKSAKRRVKDRVTDAETKVRIAKENWERKKKSQERISEFDKYAEKFAWHNGVTDGEGKTLKILPHQWEGAVYLATNQRAILADTMGTGKTLTSIATLDLVKAKRILIVTPADIASNFINEIKLWAPHRPSINMKGMSKPMRKMTLEMAQTIGEFTIVINYEIWRKDKALLHELIKMQFDTVIMDEAHTMKNMRSDAYQGMRDLIHANNKCAQCGAYLNYMADQACENCGWFGNLEEDRYGYKVRKFPQDEDGIDLRRSVRTVIPMTGSPILNSPEDLFTLLNLIDPVNFQSMHRFLNQYASMGMDGKWTFSSGGAASLLKRLSGKFLARTMKDAGVVLPEQKPIYHSLELDPQEYPLQWEVIEQLRNHASIMLAEDKVMTVMAQIALITRQRQANVWPGGIKLTDPATGEIVFDVSEKVQESIKIDKAFEMITEFVENGERIAVFSQFKTGLAQLERMLEGSTIRAVRFDGDTPNNIREQVKTNFDRKRGETPKWDVVLANYKTGGVGLNMTACTQIIMIDREWNPGKEEQAMARIQRMGQTERTFVHILEVPKTIDTWHRALIERKADLVAGFNEDQRSLQEIYLEALRKGEV